MKGKSALEIRMDLARGHFLVGEPAQAIASLEAAVREDSRSTALRALIDELLVDPVTVSARASLEGLRVRLQATVAPALQPAPAAPKPKVAAAKPSPVEPRVPAPVAPPARHSPPAPPAAARPRALAELERWLRNVPRLRRAEVRI